MMSGWPNPSSYRIERLTPALWRRLPALLRPRDGTGVCRQPGVGEVLLPLLRGAGGGLLARVRRPRQPRRDGRAHRVAAKWKASSPMPATHSRRLGQRAAVSQAAARLRAPEDRRAAASGPAARRRRDRLLRHGAALGAAAASRARCSTARSTNFAARGIGVVDAFPWNRRAGRHRPRPTTTTARRRCSPLPASSRSPGTKT